MPASSPPAPSARSAAADSAPPPPARRDPIPLESGAHPWGVAVIRTFFAVWQRPHTVFQVCPEPIQHGRIIRYLATLRLPLWAALVATVAVSRYFSEPAPLRLRSIHMYLEPALAEVVSSWLVLMIPVGLPLLYFTGGLIAHLGVALTGGAPRSIGASMRAVGYALALPLLTVGILDVPAYLGLIPGKIYLGILAAVTGVFLLPAGIALARTHRIGLARSFLVAVLPAALFAGATAGRVVLELPTVPGLETPDSPYYIP